MDQEELKKLSPEERIKRLREVEESRKQEIEEARKLIRESEEEIGKEEEQKKHVPIPQVRADSIEHLVSPEERGIYATKRFVSEQPQQAVTVTEVEPEVQLETTVEEHELREKEAREAAKQDQYKLAGMEDGRPKDYMGETADLYQVAKHDMEAYGRLMEDTKEKVGEHFYRTAQSEKMMEATDAGMHMTKALQEWYRG
jgi:hypothetical protein